MKYHNLLFSKERTLNYTSNQVADLVPLGIKLVKVFNNKKIYVRGPIGAGKTTVISTLIKIMLKNSKLVINSPTFGYINSYDNINHLDLYRLTDINQIISLGLMEYLTMESTIFVEWPEIIEDLISPDFTITIKLLPSNQRLITVIKR